MKYYASVGDQVFEIAIDRAGHISDGVDIAADMRPVGGGQLYSLLLDHVSHEVVVDLQGEQHNTYDVMVSGLRYKVRVQDERSRRLALADRHLQAPESDMAVKAPIPGLVIKILVSPGQAVTEGDTLLLLEAMKMENEIRAPRNGTIHDVRVGPGTQVAMGQVLVSLR